jgi:hypothetical protein
MKTTTLRKLISEINESNKTNPSWERLADIFNIYDLYWSDDPRLKCYFIRKWLCTDTYVGARVYFLDNKFICYSIQSARKSDEDFSFLSKELAEKLRNYLQSLVEIRYYYELMEEDELDKVISSTFKIQYNSQILHEEAFLNGELVQIIKTIYPWNDKRYFHTVEVKLPSGENIEVDCRDLDFEYNK